jgi:hypothetical protein
MLKACCVRHSGPSEEAAARVMEGDALLQQDVAAQGRSRHQHPHVRQLRPLSCPVSRGLWLLGLWVHKALWSRGRT